MNTRTPSGPLPRTTEHLPAAALIAPTATMLVDRRGTVLALDPTAQQWFGCPPVQALQAPVTRFIPAAAWNAAQRHAEPGDETAEPGRLLGQGVLTTGHHASGQELPLVIQVFPLTVAEEIGGGHHYLVLMRDPAPPAAPPSGPSAEVQALLESSPVAVCLVESDRILHASARCATLLGLPAPDLRGRSASSLVRPEMRPALQQHLAQAQVGEAATSPLRLKMDRPDGTVREIEMLFAPLPGKGRPQVQVVLLDLTLRRDERAEIEQSQLELRQLSASLVEAREAERRRIARELHDELGQQLSALKMELSTLRGAQDAPARAARIDGMLEMIDETVSSVRRIAADLRPLMLDDLGLSAALDWLAREFSRRMGIQVRLDMDDNAPAVPERASIAVYRMVQEALTNIARHAKASRAHIEIRQQDGDLLLTVDDDGVGLPAMAMHRAGSHGLVGMRERCHMLGGQLQIGASPQGGSRVAVRLPLQAAADLFVERRRTGRPNTPNDTAPRA